MKLNRGKESWSVKWVIGIFFVVTVGVGLFCVFPWRTAGVTPVVLKMEAPAGSQIELVWSTRSEDEAFRMIPWQVDDNGKATVWLTEIPPRRAYSFKLDFKTKIEGALFYELKAFQLAPTYKAIWASERSGLVPGDIEAGAVIEFPERLEMDGNAQWKRDVRLWAGLIVGFGLCIGLWYSGLRFPERLRVERTVDIRWKRNLTYGLCVVFGLIYWQLMVHSIPSFWPADSTSYMIKGLNLWDEGTYETGGYEFEFNRLPGYPLFVALSLRIFGPSVNALMLLQGAFTLLSLIYLLITLRGRWLRDEVLWVAIPLTILSPAMIWGSRQIATEGIFAGVWFLSTALFLRGWAATGWIRLCAWSGFLAVVVFATYIRANGILLLVLPGCYAVGCVWRSLLADGISFWRRRETWKGLGVLFGMAMVVGGALSLWGYRNWKERGYPYPTDLAPIVAANASFNAGMLDFRAVGDTIDYETAVRNRYNAGYFYHGWSVRNALFIKETKQWKEMEGSNLKVDRALGRFAAENRALIPFNGQLMAWWRVLDWGLWFPDETAYTRDVLAKKYTVDADYESAGKETTTLQRMEWLHKKTGIELRIEKGEPTRLAGYFNQWVGWYPWYYRLLVLASILGLFEAIRKKRYGALALMVPFWVNLFLNVYFLYVVGRYVQVFDACLVLGIAVAYFGRGGSEEKGNLSGGERGTITG